MTPDEPGVTDLDLDLDLLNFNICIITDNTCFDVFIWAISMKFIEIARIKISKHVFSLSMTEITEFLIQRLDNINHYPPYT